MKNILVTGGAGYIGSHTVVELIGAGYHPIILDNFSNSEKSVLENLKSLTGQVITCYEDNFQNTEALTRIIKKEKINGVIHFAAFKAVGESVEKPLKYYQNNVAGFMDILECLLKHNVHSFVFSSSAAVYGNPPVQLVDENTPCMPTSPYGWSKYMDEVILHDICNANSHFKGTALRYFNVVGAHSSAKIGELPKGKPQNLLPIIVMSCVGKLPPFTIFGTDYPTPDGTCLRDYIHVVDLAQAHVAALKNLNYKGSSNNFSIYNLGTGQPTSVMELIETFEKVNKVKVPYKNGERRRGDPVAYYASPKKANKELSWKTEMTIEDAVADAWHWQQCLENT